MSRVWYCVLCIHIHFKSVLTKYSSIVSIPNRPTPILLGVKVGIVLEDTEEEKKAISLVERLGGVPVTPSSIYHMAETRIIVSDGINDATESYKSSTPCVLTSYLEWMNMKNDEVDNLLLLDDELTKPEDLVLCKSWNEKFDSYNFLHCIKNKYLIYERRREEGRSDDMSFEDSQKKVLAMM